MTRLSHCLMVVTLTILSFTAQSHVMIAEERFPTAKDGEQVGKICNAWLYPPGEKLNATPTIGVHYPLHIVSVSTNDSLQKVCTHYAQTCGHRESLANNYVASGVSKDAVYLIRRFPQGSEASLPRTVFLYHSFEHTVTVTVTRPRESQRTHIDISVAARQASSR